MKTLHDPEDELVRTLVLQAKDTGMSKEAIREALNRALVRGAVYDRYRLDGAIERALALL